MPGFWLRGKRSESDESLITSVHVRLRVISSRARLRSERSPLLCSEQRGAPRMIGSVPGLRLSTFVQ